MDIWWISQFMYIFLRKKINRIWYKKNLILSYQKDVTKTTCKYNNICTYIYGILYYHSFTIRPLNSIIFTRIFLNLIENKAKTLPNEFNVWNAIHWITFWYLVRYILMYSDIYQWRSRITSIDQIKGIFNLTLEKCL